MQQWKFKDKEGNTTKSPLVQADTCRQQTSNTVDSCTLEHICWESSTWHIQTGSSRAHTILINSLFFYPSLVRLLSILFARQTAEDVF